MPIIVIAKNQKSIKNLTTDQKRLVDTLSGALPQLTLGQLHWLQRVIEVFSAEHDYSIIDSDIFDESLLRHFGDAMRIHHLFSSEPFSKDKLEYILVEVSNLSGKKASLAPKGNPGHDITLDGVKISLKTQADKGVKEDRLWVSKFMELGKGQWSAQPEELEGLRQQFFDHLSSYDRILSLRTLKKAPRWKYELVEIPKRLLELARGGLLEMRLKSKQTPKPGYCYVCDDGGERLFELYFDGGTERKLQIKNLRKDRCRVHATWEFVIPQG